MEADRKAMQGDINIPSSHFLEKITYRAGNKVTTSVNEKFWKAWVAFKVGSHVSIFM